MTTTVTLAVSGSVFLSLLVVLVYVAYVRPLLAEYGIVPPADRGGRP